MAQANLPFSYSSLHQPSLNPELYIGLMKAYIAHDLAGLKLKGKELAPELLYQKISYPSITQGNKLYALLAAAPGLDNLPDNPLNAAVLQSRKNIVLNAQAASSVFLKFPRTDDKQAQERALFEFYIGGLLNKLRRKLPNFACTLGLLKTFSNPEPTLQALLSTSSPAVCHLLYERIPGKTLAATLQEPSLDARKFYLVLFQLLFALQKAQDKLGFVHNSLYPENIIMRSTELSSLSFQLGSRLFELPIDSALPTIIDFSSARATHRGFGVSYFSNPTVFTPGVDMCRLISACLAHLADKPLFEEVRWINDYFGSFFQINKGPSYDHYYRLYQGFELSVHNPLSSLSPLDFINWFQQREGELFNRLVAVKPRSIREKRLIPVLSQTTFEEHLSSIKSGIVKAYALQTYGVTIIPDPEEKAYDAELLTLYHNFLVSHPPQEYTVNYRFPLRDQYYGDKRIDYLALIPSLEAKKAILGNFLLFLRYIQTLKIPLPSSLTPSLLQQLFTDKASNRHNLDIVCNLPLSKLYQAAVVLDRKEAFDHGAVSTGEMVILIQELPLPTIRELYPACQDYIDSTIVPALLGLELPKPTYYPTCTLQQFAALSTKGKPSPSLVELVVKSFFGSGPKSKTKSPLITEDLIRHLTEQHNDVQIYLDLRRYFVPVSIDRGRARARDITNLIKDLSNFRPKTYLDFGGSNGEISSAIAKVFNLSKENAYSADIDSWFGREMVRPYANISYLSLRENQPIPLPDASIDVVTCFQVLHHVRNIDFVLGELRRVCRQLLIVREHDCRDDQDRMLIDVEHSLFELCIEPNPRISYLNEYEAWYRSRGQWTKLISKYGFSELKHSLHLHPTPTRYFYMLFRRV